MTRAGAGGEEGIPTSLALVTVGFGVLAGAVTILLLTPPASEYEISIYGALPWYFWALMIGGLFIAQLVIIRSVTGSEADQPYWRLGFLLALLFNAIIVFLPYIRGYAYFERADVLTHLGFIKNIEQTGTVGIENIYPNLHQLVLTLSYATGLEPMRVINSVAAIFGLFSIIATYTLLATVYERRVALFTLPFAILASGTAFANTSPYAMSALLFPFILYLFSREQRTHSVSIRFVLSVAAIAIVIYHPLTALFILFVLLIYSITCFASSVGIWDRSVDENLELTGSGNINKVILATGVAWYYNFAGIIIRVRDVIITTLNPGRGASQLNSYGSTVSRFSPALIDVVRIALAKYGAAAFLMGLGGLYTVKLLLDRLRGRLRASVFQVTFAASLVFFSGLSILFLVMDFIVGFGRPLMFVKFFGMFLAGSLVLAAYERFDQHRGVLVITGVVLVALVVISVFGVFHSPVDVRANQQVTSAELDGAGWFLEYHDQTVPSDEYIINLWRFEDAAQGRDSNVIPSSSTPPPDHFGYANHTTVGASYNRSHYLVINSLGRMYYQEVYPQYPQYWRFNGEDFARLETDPTVSKTYTNGGFDTYMITPATNSSTA